MAKTGESCSISRSQLLGSLKLITTELVAEFKAHDKHVAAIAFVPGRQELISGAFSGQARIWSTTDWSKIGELTGHTGSVNGFGISSDGRRAFTAMSDKTVRLWDLPKRKELSTFGNHRKPAVAVSLSADGTRWDRGCPAEGDRPGGCGRRDDWDEVRSIKIDTSWIAPFAINHDSSLLAVGWGRHLQIRR